MVLDSLGNIGIGAAPAFTAGTNQEKFLVDAGTTNSFNAIVGRGSINSYLQLNIQNQSSGTSASSDVVATADNGNESINFVDLGINSSTNTQNIMGGANDAYLYTTGNNLLIGTGTAAKALVFMTGGTTQSTNERMRIDSSAPATVTATQTYSAPGRSNMLNRYSTPAAMAPATMVPPISPNIVSRELTRTRSMVGGSTRGVMALRSTLNDFDNTIIPRAQG